MLPSASRKTNSSFFRFIGPKKMVCRVITDIPNPPPLGCGGISRSWEGITLRSALILSGNMAFDGGRLNFRFIWNWVLNIWKERFIVIWRYKINCLKWKKVDEWVSQVQFTVHRFNIPGVKIIQKYERHLKVTQLQKAVLSFSFVSFAGFFLGGGEGERHLARITLSSRRKQYICNYCSVIVRK